MKSKEEYIDSLATELKELSAEIDALTAKAEILAVDARLKYQEDIESLKEKERIAIDKLKELQNAGGDAWKVIKDTAELVWHDLRTGLASVASKFK